MTVDVVELLLARMVAEVVWGGMERFVLGEGISEVRAESLVSTSLVGQIATIVRRLVQAPKQDESQTLHNIRTGAWRSMRRVKLHDINFTLFG